MGIEEKIYILNLDDPVVRKRYEENLARIREELRPLTDSLRRSSQLTAADYNIRINAGPIELPENYDFSQLFIDY